MFSFLDLALAWHTQFTNGKLLSCHGHVPCHGALIGYWLLLLCKCSRRFSLDSAIDVSFKRVKRRRSSSHYSITAISRAIHHDTDCFPLSRSISPALSFRLSTFLHPLPLASILLPVCLSFALIYKQEIKTCSSATVDHRQRAAVAWRGVPWPQWSIALSIIIYFPPFFLFLGFTLQLFTPPFSFHLILLFRQPLSIVLMPQLKKIWQMK